MLEADNARVVKICAFAALNSVASLCDEGRERVEVVLVADHVDVEQPRAVLGLLAMPSSARCLSRPPPPQGSQVPTAHVHGRREALEDYTRGAGTAGVCPA